MIQEAERRVPSFGTLLRQFRNEQELSLREVEARADGTVSFQYLGFLETGVRPTPSLAFACPIVKALGLDAARARILLAVAVYDRIHSELQRYVECESEFPELDDPIQLPPDSPFSAAELIIGPIDNHPIVAGWKVELIKFDSQHQLSFVISE